MIAADGSRTRTQFHAPHRKRKLLGIFDSIIITPRASRSELPETANVVIDISERPGDSLEYFKRERFLACLKAEAGLNNLFGYGDYWYSSVDFGEPLEISSGVSWPRFGSISAIPLSARVWLRANDWLKLSSYERALRLSLGLLSTRNHNLSYSLSSDSVRSQFGHDLLSALKYSFNVDMRDSSMRPTRGYAFASTTQFGLVEPPYSGTSRFLRQEFDLRYAIPLGFYGAALNFRISSGVLFSKTPTYLPLRFFMGGNTTSVYGLSSRALGPAEPRRGAGDNSYDRVGGDLALTAISDLSFDLPLKVLKYAGIHGHAFACNGTLNKLGRGFSVQNFKDSFRSSMGIGLVLPTKIFRMEVNYCCILKKQERDKGKSGLQLCFSSPR